MLFHTHTREKFTNSKARAWIMPWVDSCGTSGDHWGLAWFGKFLSPSSPLIFYLQAEEFEGKGEKNHVWKSSSPSQFILQTQTSWVGRLRQADLLTSLKTLPDSWAPRSGEMLLSPVPCGARTHCCCPALGSTLYEFTQWEQLVPPQKGTRIQQPKQSEGKNLDRSGSLLCHWDGNRIFWKEMVALAWFSKQLFLAQRHSLLHWTDGSWPAFGGRSWGTAWNAALRKARCCQMW